MTISEYLKIVITDEKYIEWINDSFDEKIIHDMSFCDEELLLDVITKFHNTEIRDDFWNTILDYLSPKSLTQPVFDYLIKYEIGIVALAHMDLDDSKLKILSKYAEEALFTLAKPYYTNDNYSVDDFINLINNYNNDMLFEQLIFEKPSDSRKENALIYFYYNKEQHIEKINKIIMANKLKIENNLDEIEKAYKLEDFYFNLAISDNLFTPYCILEEMSEITGIKFASKIRMNSRKTIKIKAILEDVSDSKI
jgi:hypothetical protein